MAQKRKPAKPIRWELGMARDWSWRQTTPADPRPNDAERMPTVDRMQFDRCFTQVQPCQS